MNRILLLVQRETERNLLADWLSDHPVAVIRGDEKTLRAPFDLCILDGRSLKQFHETIEELRAEQEHVFLPFLLAMPKRHARIFSGDLRQLIDELIFTPIEKIELAARVETLLRARQHSLDLKLRNNDLEAFIHAMTHDLRAPARTVKSFAHAIFEDQTSGLDEQSKEYLRRIEASADDILKLISALLTFARLERRKIGRLQKIKLDVIIEKCIRDLDEEIRGRRGKIHVGPVLPEVMADPALLKNAITGLLTNALKYVPAGTDPEITITVSETPGICRIDVRDNGIGIAEEDQKRIFEPFVRLHGIEDFPGIGLGLTSIAKMVELMGGRIGVVSALGEGSTFWIELNNGANVEIPNH